MIWGIKGAFLLYFGQLNLQVAYIRSGVSSILRDTLFAVKNSHLCEYRIYPLCHKD